MTQYLHHAHVASEEQDVPPHPAGSELGGDQVSRVILVLGVSKQCLLHICSLGLCYLLSAFHQLM